MAWSNNNLAHRWLWWSLYLLEQSKRVFPDSGTVKMRQFEFWVDADSPQMRRGKARSLAQVLANMFTGVYDATYEGLPPDASDDAQAQAEKAAITAMVQVLVAGEKTMEELADTVDGAYHFAGELP